MQGSLNRRSVDMWQDTIADVKRALAKARAAAQPKLRRAFVDVTAFVRGPLRGVVVHALQIVAALVILFLEWGWEPLAAVFAKFVQLFGFERLRDWIAGLPPYGALALFAAPAVCLIPVKLFAVYLFATGHPAVGVGLIVLAKLAGTAVVARIYMLTQPQLMRIGWFKTAHDSFMPWKDRMYAEIRASAAWRQGRIVRVEVKRALNRAWIGLKPQREWAAEQARFVRGWFVNVGKLPR
jgi:hypothetical protein